MKVPLFPVHTWLPLAHTEAPTAGLRRSGRACSSSSARTASTASCCRWCPKRLSSTRGSSAVLSIIGILYAALICWVQDDIKKLVAYSSVSHLGFCVLGLFALNPMGMQGSVIYMINHGLSTGALFFLIGMIYERYHTRDINRLGGLGAKMPVWACFMVFFVLSSVGLPGLNGFVSEFLCLIGAFASSADSPIYPGTLGPWYAAIAGIGMVLAAMYLLRMTGLIVFGKLREPSGHGGHDDEHASLPADLTPREIGVLIPLAVLCVVFGVLPSILTDRLEKPIEGVLANYPAAVENSGRLADQGGPLVDPKTELASLESGHDG